MPGARAGGDGRPKRALRARLDELDWILPCLFDIRADFRVFYRLDDPESLPAAEFFAYAERCVAYEGAVRWAWDVEAAAEEEAFGEIYGDDGLDSIGRLEEGGGEVIQTPVESSYLFDHFDVIVGDEDPEKEVVTHG